MARPGRPERNRAARSFRQLRQFHHVINTNKVFGTHRYHLAAGKGDALAQINLGVMSRDGNGVVKNYAVALKWFRLAADQGQALAQFNLGLMYANGLGPQDYVQAHMWLSLAAARGAQEALKNREIVERHMTTAQIADARELARDWKPKPIQ